MPAVQRVAVSATPTNRRTLVPIFTPLRLCASIRRTWIPRAGRAAWFARIDVTTVAAARRVGQVRELRSVRRIVDVHAVSEPVVREDVERGVQHAGHGPQRDVDDIVHEAPSV